LFLGADAVVAVGEAGVQQVVRASGTRFGHCLVQADRLTRSAHQREVLDETLEGFLSHHVGPWIAMPWRDEVALGDIDEGILLQTPRSHSLGTAMIEKPGITQVVPGATGHVTDLHAASKSQQRYQ